MGDVLKKRQFKNFLIDKDLQLRIIFTNIIYMFIVILITAGIILLPLIKGMYLGTEISVKYQAAQAFLTILPWLIPAMLLMASFIFFHHLLLTHRICGPLSHFRKILKSAGEGNLNQTVHIRKHDYLQNERKDLNEMISNLSKSINQIKVDHDKLLSDIKTLAEKPDQLSDKESTIKTIERLSAQAEKTQKGLSKFRLLN